VSAKRITIDFDKQKVATVTAIDSVVGVYVEPRPDTTRKTNATNVAGKAAPKATPQATPKASPRTPPKTPPLTSTPPKQP
jgi:hypothetical protein